MAFGFYHSVVKIPTDLEEAASTYGLTRWQRFRTPELPASAHSLIFNSMMSFGGGWFFVVQSEAISVMNKDIKLPGLGSYMAMAIEKSDNHAVLLAIVAMLTIILVSDQLVWRPLLVWADKFKMELSESGAAPTSRVYQLLGGSVFFGWMTRYVWQPLGDAFDLLLQRISQRLRLGSGHRRRFVARRVAQGALRGLVVALALWLGYEVVRAVLAAIAALHDALTVESFGRIVWLAS